MSLLLQNTRQPTIVIQPSQVQTPPPPVTVSASLTPVTEAPSPQVQQSNDVQSSQVKILFLLARDRGSLTTWNKTLLQF